MCTVPFFFCFLKPCPLFCCIPSSFPAQEKQRRLSETEHADGVQEASFREASELEYKPISLAHAMTARVKERNEVISQPSA